MVLLVKVTAIEARLSASLCTREVAGDGLIRPNESSATRLASASRAPAEHAQLTRSRVALSSLKAVLPEHPVQGATL